MKVYLWRNKTSCPHVMIASSDRGLLSRGKADSSKRVPGAPSPQPDAYSKFPAQPLRFVAMYAISIGPGHIRSTWSLLASPSEPLSSISSTSHAPHRSQHPVGTGGPVGSRSQTGRRELGLVGNRATTTTWQQHCHHPIGVCVSSHYKTWSQGSPH